MEQYFFYDLNQIYICDLDTSKVFDGAPCSYREQFERNINSLDRARYLRLSVTIDVRLSVGQTEMF